MIVSLIHREFDKMFSISVTTDIISCFTNLNIQPCKKRGRDIAIFNESLHPLVLEYYLGGYFTYCDNVQSFVQTGDL